MDEFRRGQLTSAQIGMDVLEQFFEQNEIDDDEFNRKQRIALIASSFDKETLSACAWLSKQKVDIRCLALSPFKSCDKLFLTAEQIIPPRKLESYFVEVAMSGRRTAPTHRRVSGTISRESMPRMATLLEWGIIKPGDLVHIRKYPDEKAEIIDHRTVRFRDTAMLFNEWGKKVTGWSAINIYEWTILTERDLTLDALRRAHMEEQSSQPPTEIEDAD